MVDCVTNPATGRAVRADGKLGKKILQFGFAKVSSVKGRASPKTPKAPSGSGKKRGRPKGSKNKKK